MNGWRTIVPLNLGRDCKTRLSERLNRAERDRLVMEMASHVVDVLVHCPDVAEIVVLSPEPHPFFRAVWAADTGKGLNAELAALLGDTHTIIIHADLPLLCGNDVAKLIKCAQSVGAVIAPDRFGTGTNALAVMEPKEFIPAFGVGSFALHQKLLPKAAVIRSEGLESDIDTAEDYDLFIRARPIACPI